MLEENPKDVAPNSSYNFLSNLLVNVDLLLHFDLSKGNFHHSLNGLTWHLGSIYKVPLLQHLIRHIHRKHPLL